MRMVSASMHLSLIIQKSNCYVWLLNYHLLQCSVLKESTIMPLRPSWEKQQSSTAAANFSSSQLKPLRFIPLCIPKLSLSRHHAERQHLLRSCYVVLHTPPHLYIHVSRYTYLPAKVQVCHSTTIQVFARSEKNPSQTKTKPPNQKASHYLGFNCAQSSYLIFLDTIQ